MACPRRSFKNWDSMHLHAPQVSTSISLLAAAAAAAPALGALLRGAPQTEREESSGAMRRLLHCFLYPFAIEGCVRVWGHLAAQLARDTFWQRVIESPSALVETLEALQLRHPTAGDAGQDATLVREALSAHAAVVQHVVSGAVLQHVLGPHVQGSDSLHRTVMELLASDPLQHEAHLSAHLMPFISFLLLAAKEDGMSEARLGALLSHKGIIRTMTRGGFQLGGLKLGKG